MAEQPAQDKGPLAGGELKQDEAPELRDLIMEYGRPIVIGVGAALVITLGTGLWRQHRATQEREAAALLDSGRPEQMQALLNQYPGTSTAPAAMLALARGEFGTGQYVAAEKRYAEFLARFPNHAMRPAAEINRALCHEAMGRTDEALTAVEAWLGVHTNDFLRPVALFAKARCVEQKGRYDDARAIYEDFIAKNPDTSWTPQAETALKALAQKRRSASAAASTPVAVPPKPAAVPAPAPATPAPAAPAAPATPAVPAAPATNAPAAK